jgi:hypothetical protein
VSQRAWEPDGLAVRLALAVERALPVLDLVTERGPMTTTYLMFGDPLEPTNVAVQEGSLVPAAVRASASRLTGSLAVVDVQFYGDGSIYLSVQGYVLEEVSLAWGYYSELLARPEMWLTAVGQPVPERVSLTDEEIALVNESRGVAGIPLLEVPRG